MEASGVNFPVKPTEPLDSECCGTGCTPCVFDIYKTHLRKWEEECDRIRDNNGASSEFKETTTTFQLTPENYLNFKLVNIFTDTNTSNIYRFDASPCPLFSPSQENEDGSPNHYVISRQKPPIKIGQHVVMKIENEAKQYTVLDVNKSLNIADDQSNFNYYFDFLIKIYSKGTFTPLIGRLQVGDTISMRGPFGKSIKLGVNACDNIIMLAAGTGIAPMYRLIEFILRNDEENTRIKLIYCNRSVESVLLKEKLKEWSQFWNFQVVHFLSRNGGQEIPYGMRNHVRLKRFARADFVSECQDPGLVDGKKSRFFVCGTKSFEKDMLNYMTKCGVQEAQYHVF